MTITLATEAIPLGQPFADALAADERAIAEQRQRALAELFPVTVTPTPSDAYAAHAHHLGRHVNTEAFGAAAAALHGRCLTTWPALAGLLRSADTYRDVGRAAARQAAPSDRAAAAEPAQARFAAAIARQLAEAGHDLAGPAAALLECDDLAARLGTCRARHEAFAAEALARAQAERAAVERARQAELDRVVAEAAAEAERAKNVALAAAADARRARARRLAERIVESGLDGICVGNPDYDPTWSTAGLPDQLKADTFADDTLARLEAALDETLRRRKGRAA